MAGNSFDVVNYSVRPNKNVERKLLAESLAALAPQFNISDYRYVGFGSMWFTDFALFHRTLQISDMISIEGGGEDAVRRAEFNRPHTCICVLGGYSTEVLASAIEDKKRSIVWLDYDKGPGEAPAEEDIEIFFRHASSGSIVMFSMNAHGERIRLRKDTGKGFKPRLEGLKDLLKHLVPSWVKEDDLKNETYPSTLARIFLDHMKSIPVRLGRTVKFIPLYNIYYRDGAPMITVGGMLCDKSDETTLTSLNLDKRFFYIGEEPQLRIEVPHLTPKEKILIDCTVPYNLRNDCKMIGLDGLGPNDGMENAPISREMLEQYVKFHRYFPYYAEVI
ncbi:hypothetical protein CU669_11885 [Paramagnetospirillum kuznetsovii]|uniref:Uncharacterized protein n=1 Tax=Paramagnetospirillum kuznetsovii TaxID=2053833 RepID=A0A364NX79_9PROT|nr:O-methyltransferase [Paramagnetospirillum kuznetsovii]RAU21672.1 hypothetical protein CU669_11885 [Paramagnetospirillum kuznetsovii]